MKTTSYPTEHILIKAQTNSDWDECHFAIIHCPQKWKETMQQRLKTVQSIESKIGFSSLKYYDTSVDFYCTDEDINDFLGDKDWAFIELENGEQETFLVPENRMNNYHLSFYQFGTAMFTAQAKHSCDEFWTSEFSVPEILNHHQTIKIIQLY